jgi:hypothetical protein
MNGGEMKKITLVLFLMTLVLASCSMPRLVKIEDAPDPTATTVPALIIFSTATSVPVIPEDIVVPTPVSPRDILMKETFSSEDGSWDIGVWSENAGKDSITNGEYHMTLYRTSYMIWSQTFDFYTSDVELEVDARLHAGTQENGQGFVCRYTDVDNFYFLFIGNDGWYSIDKYVDDKYENLLSGQAPDGIIDPVANKIKALCAGNTLSLTVNDYFLGSVQDWSHSYGEVGLFTQSYNTGNITIAYDNFTVYDASDAR